MNKLLRLEPYNETWKIAFQEIKQYLDSLLAGLVVDIVHVGSTSVPTMTAKPIIDIDIIFEENLPYIIQILEQNHYRYEGTKGIADRHAFKRTKNDFHEHHLYACLKGSEALENHLQLKRALQMNPKHRIAYSRIKEELIQKNNVDRELYTDSKTEVIVSILKEELEMKSIVLAGGCFWGVEAYFKQLEGVSDTEVGYINGPGETSYKEVCNGSGHAEAVLIHYDENLISLKKILDHFFNIIDPTSINKQGNDVGIQYRTGIYNYLPEQLPFIQNYISVRQKEYTNPIRIEFATNEIFYQAEDYHQDYLEKNKHGYCHVDLTSYKNVK